EDVRPERDTSRTPLFQVMFAFQDVGGVGVTLPGLRLEPLAVDAGTAQFDLTLSASRGEIGALVLSLEYNTDLLEGATAERLLGHFCTLTASTSADPECR